MSNLADQLEQGCEAVTGCAAVELILTPRVTDLGGFSVRRVLPAIGKKMIGPWVFFDHMGPAEFTAGSGINVAPHPHIGIATVTYLFEGEILHRDSLGSLQPIRPGDINLMVAGSGIVHSERERPEISAQDHRLHGLQLWLALPADQEEIPPAFHHYSSAEIPTADIDGVPVRVMMGQAYGLTSPVHTFSETLYFEADLRAGQSLTLPDTEELGVYAAAGAASLGDTELAQYSMAVLQSPRSVVVRAQQDTRLAGIGGSPLGARFMEWNFVSSRKERIAQAKDDWMAGRFTKVVGDEEEWIPLPGRQIDMCLAGRALLEACLVAGATFTDVDGVHPRRDGALVAGFNQCGYRVISAPGLGFHTAIGTVADPATQAQPPSLFDGPVAVAHSLDPAADLQMHCSQFDDSSVFLLPPCCNAGDRVQSTQQLNLNIDEDTPMFGLFRYRPPKVWQWENESGGKFASINRPVSGATHDKVLPQGEHSLQLYSLATPNGVKVTILLEELLELGISAAEYDAYTINIEAGDQFGSGFVAINPNSKIPALLDVGETPPQRVFESGAILLYLAEKFDAFYPKDRPTRAACQSWLMWQMGSAPFLGGGFGHFYAYAPEKFQYPIDRYTMEVKRQLDVLDKHLADSRYLCGDEYTIADMATYPWYGALVLGRLYDAAEFLDVQSYRHVIRWASEIDERPAVRRGRRVNRVWGDEDKQMAERHSAEDFKQT